MGCGHLDQKFLGSKWQQLNPNWCIAKKKKKRNVLSHANEKSGGRGNFRHSWIQEIKWCHQVVFFFLLFLSLYLFPLFLFCFGFLGSSLDSFHEGIPHGLCSHSNSLAILIGKESLFSKVPANCPRPDFCCTDWVTHPDSITIKVHSWSRGCGQSH